MNNPIGKEEAMTAACWWADLLRKPAPQNAGDAQLSLICAINGMNAERPSAEQIGAFEVILANLILQDTPGVIEVDYNPCEELCRAAKEAGFSAHDIFPVKTLMTIDPNHVSVSLGYGASFVELMQGQTE